MTKFLNRKSRRSIRLRGYDYSQEGAYYITICAQDRLCLFGEVKGREMVLNEKGLMINHWLVEISNKFKNIEIGEYIIMPNHIHAIVVNHGVGVDLRVNPNDISSGTQTGVPLSTIVQWFKTMSTNAYIRGVKELKWERFNGKLWQRNYYEHIIRDGNDYERIANYIQNNPINWKQDGLHLQP